jgi:hypothetical protein
MPVEQLFPDRVSEAQVAGILQLIDTLPSRRDQPIPGDVSGKFDFWFDGGAGRIITGWTEYQLADGTTVTVGVTPLLTITLDFSNGSRVVIQQDRSSRPAGARS